MSTLFRAARAAGTAGATTAPRTAATHAPVFAASTTQPLVRHSVASPVSPASPANPAGISVIRNGKSTTYLQGEQFFLLNSMAKRAYHDYAGKKNVTGYVQPKDLCDVNAVRNLFALKGLAWKRWWDMVFEGNPMYDGAAEREEVMGGDDLVNPNTRLSSIGGTTTTVGSNLFWTMYKLAGYLPNSIRPGFTVLNADDLVSALEMHGAVVVSVNNMALPTSKYRTHHTFTPFDYEKTSDGVFIYSIDGDETTALAERIRAYALAEGINAADVSPEKIKEITGDACALVRRDRADVLAANICRPILAADSRAEPASSSP